jgi:hypothetical protein
MGLNTTHVSGRYREKVQGWALMDRGSTPPPSDEDDPIAAGTTAPTIGEDM